MMKSAFNFCAGIAAVACVVATFLEHSSGGFDHVVENVGDPSDMREEVDFSARVIRAAVKEKSPDAGPVVVIFGESHDHSAHVFFQMMLVTKLRDLNPLIASELSYKKEVNDRWRFSSPLAFLIYSAFTTEKGVGFVFNDAADFKEGDRWFVDNNDSSTRAAIFKYNPALENKKIDELSVDGIAVRNLFMAQFAIDVSRKEKKEIVFQEAGASHVLGDTASDYSYRDSLAQRYLDFGASRVVVILPQSERFDPKIRAPFEFLQEKRIVSILVKGLSEEKFKFYFQSAERDKNFETLKREFEFINSLGVVNNYYVSSYSSKFREELEKEISLQLVQN